MPFSRIPHTRRCSNAARENRVVVRISGAVESDLNYQNMQDVHRSNKRPASFNLSIELRQHLGCATRLTPVWVPPKTPSVTQLFAMMFSIPSRANRGCLCQRRWVIKASAGAWAWVLAGLSWPIEFAAETTSTSRWISEGRPGSLLPRTWSGCWIAYAANSTISPLDINMPRPRIPYALPAAVTRT